MATLRGRIGATVRLYGYPGTYTLGPTTALQYNWHASPMGHPSRGFPVLDASIVEVDGQPVPLISWPIAPPASDYPHGPTMVVASEKGCEGLARYCRSRPELWAVV
jgi:hypothetical protein